MSGKILIVEDDQDLAEALFDTLILADYKTDIVHSAEAALEKLKTQPMRMVISDINMPGKSGLDLLGAIKNINADLPVLLMTAYGSVADAVSAIRSGAEDYLLKPFEPTELIAKVKNILNKIPSNNHQEFIAIDQSSLDLLSMAKKVATTDATVLISGESGTGKEVLARFIHQNSNRADGPFIAVNCAAIPEAMLEATLFGYEKGAFTGAVNAYQGKFEQAQGGTLLLDEISEMDLGLQAKLLRVLQEKEVEKIGSKKMIQLDVRIIATTNRHLQIEAQEGRFREDLFYRLNVFPLRWLPLRERSDDIIPMAQYLLRRHAKEMAVTQPILTPSAKEFLSQYHWPGNIREMDNIMHRMVILFSGCEINAEDLPLDVSRDKKNREVDGITSLKNHEYELILEALKNANGSRSEVAKNLGISPRTLRYKLAKMRDMGMDIPPSIRS